MKRQILLLLFSINTIFLFQNIGELSIEHLGFEKGLSQITVFALYQDENGGIWIGTNDGLMHYRGNTVENISNAQPELDLASGIVSTICGDKDGHVYALINNKIVEYDLIQENLHFLDIPADLINNRFTAIYKGVNGLWIGTSNAIYQYKNGKTVKYATLSATNTTITAICEITDGKLIVGTIDMGVYIVDNAQKEFNVLTNCGNVNTIVVDSRKNSWICTNENGLYKIDNQLNIKLFAENGAPSQKLSSNVVRSVCEDNNDNLWIGTFAGLDKMNLSTNEIEHYGLSLDKRHSLSSNSIRCITKDKQGTIWIGTYYGGINFFNPEPEIFKFFDFQKTLSDFTYPIIGNMVEDIRGDCWICSDGKGLIYFNKAKGTYQYYSTENSSISGNNIKSIYYDKIKDVLWIGTYRHGLNRLDLRSKQFTHYKIGALNSTIPNEWQETVQTMVPYKDQLFLGTLYGVFSFNTRSGIATHLVLTKSIRDMLLDGTNLWIAGQEGLTKFDLRTNTVSKEYKQSNLQANNLPKNRITKLFIDRKKRFWISTDGGGLVLLNRKNDTFTLYDSRTCGIESNNVSCINESKYGYILVGTSKGFSHIDVERNKSVNYSTKNGFPLLSMSYGSIFISDDGELLMGGIDGLTRFKEEALSNSGKEFSMKFTALSVNNRTVVPGDETKILKMALPYTKKIVLQANQKIIDFEFATDNYIKTNQPNFQYKLEGFDKQWLDFDPKNTISYMNLPDGSYTLKVRSLFQKNEENADEISLFITVLPPIYARWYAYLLYFILISGISIWIFRFYQSRLLLRTSLEYERREKEQNEFANQSKLRFFTNISHEFRTPLTLILGQIEMLMQSSKIAPNFYNSIVNVHNNALKMNQLIGELLDFRKQEQGFKKLKVSQHDLVDYLREVCVSFQEFAKFHGIELTFSTNKGTIPILFDYVELQKVFYNLISNAFKFTPKGGKIDVAIDANDTNVKITVSDSGIGISKENLDKIFERFYQAENEGDSSLQSKGTGIGLALAKGIVELHKGTISVSSTPSIGSVFTVDLHYGDAHFINNEKVEIAESSDEHATVFKIQSVLDDEFLQEASENQRKHFDQKPTILIVEDNERLRKMLVQLFESMYNVIESNNGKSGYQMAVEKHPDIILSDVMMPEMNGNEMCSKIKGNFETCHIPVVLLTAQTSLDQNIDGLKRGADDYITKPFNVKILVTRCNNLLLSRKVLQEKFSKQLDTNAFNIATNELDQAFIEKAISIVEQNIRNEKLDVTLLCSEMAIGRRVFFYKMKSITGQTPNDFIQNIRFKKAAWILQHEPDKTISEISEELGYNSVSYFGKSFKSKFGVLPSAYRNNLTRSEKNE